MPGPLIRRHFTAQNKRVSGWRSCLVRRLWDHRLEDEFLEGNGGRELLTLLSGPPQLVNSHDQNFLYRCSCQVRDWPSGPGSSGK